MITVYGGERRTTKIPFHSHNTKMNYMFYNIFLTYFLILIAF